MGMWCILKYLGPPKELTNIIYLKKILLKFMLHIYIGVHTPYTEQDFTVIRCRLSIRLLSKVYLIKILEKINIFYP